MSNTFTVYKSQQPISRPVTCEPVDTMRLAGRPHPACLGHCTGSQEPAGLLGQNPQSYMLSWIPRYLLEAVVFPFTRDFPFSLPSDLKTGFYSQELEKQKSGMIPANIRESCSTPVKDCLLQKRRKIIFD